MKVTIYRLTSLMLVFFFIIGFANSADAAYAGKKKANTETSVSITDPSVVTPAQTPPDAVPVVSTPTLLLVILSFILPPLAVYLKYEEISTPFWVNVVLTLLFWVPGVIHALYHVLVR